MGQGARRPGAGICGQERGGEAMKYTRFTDIPQMTREGSWECDFELRYILGFIEELKASDGLDLNPDFQRAHVWTEQQQIAFMEFLLRGGRTGRVLYFNNPGWQNYNRCSGVGMVIVDGKQRLEAIRRFVQNEIPVFGTLFKDYTDRTR